MGKKRVAFQWKRKKVRALIETSRDRIYVIIILIFFFFLPLVRARSGYFIYLRNHNSGIAWIENNGTNSNRARARFSRRSVPLKAAIRQLTGAACTVKVPSVDKYPPRWLGVSRSLLFLLNIRGAEKVDCAYLKEKKKKKEEEQCGGGDGGQSQLRGWRLCKEQGILNYDFRSERSEIYATPRVYRPRCEVSRGCTFSRSCALLLVFLKFFTFDRSTFETFS